MSRWAWSSVWNLTGRDWVILPSRVRSCWWLESRTPNGLEWPLDKNPLSSNGSMMLGVVVQCSICSCLWDSLDFLKMPFSLPCAHECIGWVVILLKLAKSFMTWLILCGTEDRLWARSQTFFEMKWIHRWGVPWQRWMKTELLWNLWKSWQEVTFQLGTRAHSTLFQPFEGEVASVNTEFAA